MTIGDWREDAPLENGNYECACVICRRHFFGNKHRVVCRLCAACETSENDFDTGPANERARASEANLAAARKSFNDELDRVGRDPEDAEGSPWPAVAMVAVVLTAAALAWWFA